MSGRMKHTIAAVAVMGLWFTAIGAIDQAEAHATGAVTVEQANPTITITTGGSSPYTYNPAQLNAKVGQAITITNDHPNGAHSVTAKNRSFTAAVPPKGT